MYLPSGGGGMPSLFRSSNGIGRLVAKENIYKVAIGSTKISNFSIGC